MARWFCDSAADAVHMARQEAGTAICWTKNFDVIVLAASTPFGGVVRRWTDKGQAFLDTLIDETVAAGNGDVWTAGPVVDVETAIRGFEGSMSSAPVSLSGGERRSTWWSRVRRSDKEFAVGDELRVRILQSAEGWDVVYEATDGRPAGMHIRTTQRPAGWQRAIVERAIAIVERAAFGIDFDSAGREIVTQILVLSVPYELVAAFPEGSLPRLRDIEMETL